MLVYILVRKSSFPVEVKFCMCYLMMTIWVRWRTNAELITKFGGNITIKSINDKLLSKIWLGSLINCLDPHWQVKDSSFFYIHQLFYNQNTNFLTLHWNCHKPCLKTRFDLQYCPGTTQKFLKSLGNKWTEG